MFQDLSKIWPNVLKGAGLAFDYSGHQYKARAYERAGQSAQIAGDLEAQQLEGQAGQAIGVGQINAQEAERQGRIAVSRALAVAAASGGGASDPTVINIMSRLAGQAHLNAMSALYEGQDQARQMRNQAAMARYGGALAKSNADQSASSARWGASMTALGALGGAAKTMYEKYGGASNKPSLTPQQWDVSDWTYE